MSTDDRRYLRPNTAARPLLNHWIVWDMLVPPVQAALVIAKRHLPTMQSYIEAPQHHAKAAKTPGLLGGPWIDYETPKVDEIRALLARTRQQQGHLIELASAISALDDLLRKKAKGDSLEPLYAEVPAPLRGYVELVYDLNHHPALRLLDGLLYRSTFYTRSLQHFSFGAVDHDLLPYERSTPVLDDRQQVLAALPWDDRRLDDLFASEHVPVRIEEMQEHLGLEARHQARFQELFTSSPAPRRHTPPEDGMRIRYFGHACLLIESRDISILTDPFVSYEYPNKLPRYTLCDLPEKIDYVLITHGHGDHIRPETLLRLRHRVSNVVVPHCAGRRLQDPSLRLMLRAMAGPWGSSLSSNCRTWSRFTCLVVRSRPCHSWANTVTSTSRARAAITSPCKADQRHVWPTHAIWSPPCIGTSSSTWDQWTPSSWEWSAKVRH
jgi:hypothetical protein